MQTSSSRILLFFACLVFFGNLGISAKPCSRPPPAPKSGRLSITPLSRHGFRYKVGSVVKYSCKKNYMLRGVKSRVCGRNGRWSPQGKKSKCVPVGCGVFPKNLGSVESRASNSGPIYPFGTKVYFTCPPPFVIKGTSRIVCDATGSWLPKFRKPRCILTDGCGSPPGPPSPNGTSTDSINTSTYPAGTRINYSCPIGYGLDGIPYRICTEDGVWLPRTPIHRCIFNLNTCHDPGIPEHGFRRVQSFGHGRMAAFGCGPGYKQKGNHLRTCDASSTNSTFWDGDETRCIDTFKQSEELAAQLRESFIDRTISCNNVQETNDSNTTCPTEEPVNLSDITFCHGRTVTLGEGCLDLAYAIDCSGSVTLSGFNRSKDFVSKTIRLFELEKGTERVSLVTYDDQVHPEFGFGDVSSTRDAMARVQQAKFHEGATSTNNLLRYLKETLFPTARPECKKVLFILSDGKNNWGGDPEKNAEDLRKSQDVEIYTIAIGTGNLGWASLKQMASGPNHFFAIRSAEEVEEIVNMAISVPLDYGSQCGRKSEKENPCRDELADHCRSRRGAWPWMVGVYILEKNDSKPEIICGGVLISSCHVLTAAHCLKKREYEHLLVVVGNTDRLIEERTEETIKVCETRIHHDYDSDTLDYDIALLKLCCNVTYSTYIRKLCLPDCLKDRSLYDTGTTCTVAGWGATNVDGDFFHLSTHLHHINLPIADKDSCKELSTFPITDRMFCAGDATGDKGVCKGDSGGPLFCKRKDHNSWVMTGIVSWGEGCKRANKYDIFTNICSGNMTSWINYIMNILPCDQCYDSDCSCKDKPEVIVY